MPNSNFNIKLQDHYKLYILPKDQIIFESQLLNNNIKFYYNIHEQSNLSGGIRYFLLDSDMDKINDIIIKKKIIANVKTNLVSDFDDQKKIFKLIVTFIAVIVGVIILIIIFGNLIG
ncbi:hypothetical protein [Winogradskyella schleiferi]|uniref:hypothetical protein n=1 Tax=Winogradskyella schleiferi TaxID=2686078 RepID=UPI0015BCE652|nr:hypothetical protein [Winogradskyella schleiferi]